MYLPEVHKGRNFMFPLFKDITCILCGEGARSIFGE